MEAKLDDICRCLKIAKEDTKSADTPRHCVSTRPKVCQQLQSSSPTSPTALFCFKSMPALKTDHCDYACCQTTDPIWSLRSCRSSQFRNGSGGIALQVGSADHSTHTRSRHRDVHQQATSFPDTLDAERFQQRLAAATGSFLHADLPASHSTTWPATLSPSPGRGRLLEARI